MLEVIEQYAGPEPLKRLRTEVVSMVEIRANPKAITVPSLEVVLQSVRPYFGKKAFHEIKQDLLGLYK